MSYDLEIWSVRPFEPASMPKGTGVTSAGRDYAVLGCGWQIVINSSDKMLPEDLPDEVAAALPGIRYLTELNLEGKATHRTRTVLQSTANKIAQRMHGVVLDPQRDLIITPSGVTRLLCAKTEKGASQEKGFAFASVPDWSGKMDVIKVSGSAPEAISLLPGEGMGPKQKYPPVWPFSRAPNVFGLATRERSVDSGKR